MEATRRRPSEGAVLGTVGLLLLLAGLGLVAAGALQLTAMIPPTYGTVTNVLFALGIGFPLLITGTLYLLVARTGVEPEFGTAGISVRRDPLTGAREWMRLEAVAQATLRPWGMGPWIHRQPYGELKLVIRAGDRTYERRFFVRLGAEEGPVRRRLAEGLGKKLAEPPAAA